MTDRSSLAIPPITDEEAKAAPTSICPYHGAEPAPGWFREGRVFLCPLGEQYWRYQSKRGGIYARLEFPKGL